MATVNFQMTEKLIECVKKHPYLYDSKDVYYKNIALKNKLWEQIGKDINETAEIAKTKWKSLRDNYGRYKREMADPTVQVKKFLKWPWSNHLQFLDATIGDRDKNKSRNSDPPPQQFLEVSITEPELYESRDSNGSEGSPAASPQHQHEIEILPDEYIPPVKRMRESMAEQSTELDAVDHLFQSYAQTFKTFSRRNQIALKVELAQLFADIEAKEMMEKIIV